MRRLYQLLLVIRSGIVVALLRVHVTTTRLPPPYNHQRQSVYAAAAATRRLEWQDRSTSMFRRPTSLPSLKQQQQPEQEQLRQEDDEKTSSDKLNAAATDDFASMRVAQLKRELDARSIDYTDCFDKESLIVKLRQHSHARIVVNNSGAACAAPSATAVGETQATLETEPTTNDTDTVNCDATSTTARTSKDTANESSDKATTSTANVNVIDEMAESIQVEDVSKLSVRQLREELASRQFRWAGLLEKRDLVQAVVNARTAAQAFSVTGLLRPGTVTDVTEEQLQRELATSPSTLNGQQQQHPPLLVDVYAVWCGPCQMLSKQLVEAAATWGDSVRVVKIDSDKYPNMAAQLRAQALPTLVLFGDTDTGKAKNGKGGGATASSSSNSPVLNEIARIEGAMNKDQLVQWVQSKLKE